MAARLHPLPPPRGRRRPGGGALLLARGGRRAAAADPLRLAVRPLRRPLHGLYAPYTRHRAALGRAAARRAAIGVALVDPGRCRSSCRHARELRDTAAIAPSTVPGYPAFSADLLSLVVPSPLQTSVAAAHPGGCRPTRPARRGGFFLGFLPLVLAASALVAAARRALFWALAALLFTRAGARADASGRGGRPGVPLPYLLLNGFRSSISRGYRIGSAWSSPLALRSCPGWGWWRWSGAWRAVGPQRTVALVVVPGGGAAGRSAGDPLPDGGGQPRASISNSPPQRSRARSSNCPTASSARSPTTARRSTGGRSSAATSRGGSTTRSANAPPFRDLAPPGTDITPGVETVTVGRRVLEYAGVRSIVIFRNDPDLDQETWPTSWRATPNRRRSTRTTRSLSTARCRATTSTATSRPSRAGTRARSRPTAGRASAGSGTSPRPTSGTSPPPRATTPCASTPALTAPPAAWRCISTAMSSGSGRSRTPGTRESRSPGSGGHLLEFFALDPPVRPLDPRPPIRDDRSLSFAVANLVLADR